MGTLIKIWKNKWKILEGLKNYIFKNSKYEKIAKQRMEICRVCPDIDMIGAKCAVPGTAPCCGACGCKLALKTRTMSIGCGNEAAPKWHAVMSEIEMDELIAKGYKVDE